MWLSRGITLVESQLMADNALVGNLIDALSGINSSNFRLGITGVSGDGGEVRLLIL